MNWIVFLSLGALLSFSPIGYAEEEEENSDYEEFSIATEEPLSVEEDDLVEEIEQEDETVQEELDSVPIHSEMALKKIKTKPSGQLIEEAEPKAKAAQKEATRKIQAQKLEKISTENEESAALQIDESLQESEPLAGKEALSLNKIPSIQINIQQVFGGAPIIYTILAVLSTIAFAIWSYTMFTVRSAELLPQQMLRDLKSKLISNQFTDALMLCQKERHFFCKMVATGILARKQGLGIMVDMMKAEGKRSTVGFWQRLNLLNDIAIIAPMLGLLGTVMGMFYAFYDLHRSSESLSILFDGLGVSVGTTIAGLVVAIFAMVLHSIAKFRLVKALANLENETQGMAALIETKGPSYLETT